MHTTWRATAGHSMLALAFGVSILVPLLAHRPGADPVGAGAGATWLLAILIAGGLLASIGHYRHTERFRRHLALGLTHHLRTSLAHIRTYNEMLLLGQEESEQERLEWLEIVGREAEKLGAAVENVLMIVGDPKDQIATLRRRVDLGALLEDVASVHAGPAGAAVTFEFDPPAGVMVYADPAALKHALANLMDGVGRCCIPGSAVTAELTTRGQTATVQVATGGCGSLPAIASWRTRGNVPNPDACSGIGFGLELAVADRIARAHGGRAGRYHEAGRSGYSLTLPLSAA